MIKSLKVKNFGPHKEREFEFESKTYLFIGPNGCGKSNLVRSLSWSGWSTKGLPSEITQDEIIRDGADKVTVETELEMLGSTFKFFRAYDGNSVDAKVYRDGNLVADSSTGVRAYLMSSSMDWDAFSVLCSQQRELDSFVYSTPSERKKIFDSLLRTEVVEEARKLARANIPDLEKPSILADQERSDLKDELEQKEGKIQDCKGKLEDVPIDIIKKKLEKKREEFSDKSYDDEISDLKAKVGKLSVQMMHTQKKVVDYDLENLQDSYESNEELLKEARSELNLLDSDREEKQDTINRLRGKYEAVESLATELDSGSCPVCSTNISDKEGLQKSVRERRLPSIHERIHDLTEQVSNLQEKTDALREEIGNLEDHQKSLKNKIDDAKVSKQAEAELEKLQHQQDKLKSELDDLVAKRPDDLAEEIQELESDLDNARQRKDEIKTDISALDFDREKIEDKIQQYDEAEEEYREKEKAYDLWSSTTKNITAFRDKVLSDALSWVSHRATRLLHRFGNFPEIDADAKLKVNNDLRFLLVSGDQEFPVYRFSGGQTAVFSIFLRIALSDYLASRLGMKGTMILDAALDSVDPENTAVVSQVLNQVNMNQALIFSHKDLPELEAERIYLEQQ